ncbi:hypothetical protein CRE_06662 [Caenorhabditis remanei]|uniref:Uncharacterized protein n=1 Tax=Caenorhabditis remanei TaxID=31234 RepID=E3M0S9_CAERE|nr:hypothetical protein CRE_06662 [Caenorhabditis remanei]
MFSLIFLLILLKITSSVPVVDPEFEEYDNWLQRNRSILMMKHLPKNANYTWKEYFTSWNMMYEKEMARKELSFEAAEFIENTLSTIDSTTPSAIQFDVSLKFCPNRTGWYQLDRRIEEVPNDFRIHITWSAEYYGSETIGEWCKMGSRETIKMGGNVTIKTVLHGVNVTFTCPFSMYHAVRNVFIVETKNSWRFSKFFYISVIALVVSALIGIVVLILFRYTQEYYRFGTTPAETPEEFDHNHNETEVPSEKEDFVPVRK